MAERHHADRFGSASTGHNLAVPEGHLLHRLARDQQELVGQTVAATSPQGRFADAAAAVDGRSLSSVEAYGKHLRHRYDFERGVHVHLGMQGKWIRLSTIQPPRPQVRLRLATPAVAWDLIAPSTCTLIDDAGWAQLVSTLGPDPLRADADPDVVFQALSRSPGPIGAALLDQSVVAGIGNVLRAEGLFLAGIHPSSAASSVDRPTFDRLWTTMVGLMKQSVDDGRIISAPIPAEKRATVAENDGRMVYKQANCRECGTPVDVFLLAGRTAYACPVCQPPPPNR